MHQFTDRAGRDWQIDINVTTIKHLRDVLEIDLLAVAGGDLLERLADDPILLADCLYVLCRDQAKARDVSDEDFGRALAGDAIDAASRAFLDDLIAFFRPPRREVLAGAIKKISALQAQAGRMILERLESDELDDRLRQALTSSVEPSGESPATSESTPDPEPSASSS